MPLGPKLLSEYRAAWNANVSSSVILLTLVPHLLTDNISIATPFCITSFNIVLNYHSLILSSYLVLHFCPVKDRFCATCPVQKLVDQCC